MPPEFPRASNAHITLETAEPTAYIETFEDARRAAHELLSDAEYRLQPNEEREGDAPTTEQEAAVSKALQLIEKAKTALDRAAG